MKTAMLLGITAALTGSAVGQRQPVKDVMNSLYQKLEVAYNAGDTNTIMSDTGPDFRWRMLDGKSLNQDEFRKDLKEQFGSTQKGKWTISVENLIGAGQLATAIVQFDFKGSMIDSSKHAYNGELQSVERQTWLLGTDGWKMESDSVLSAWSHNSGTTQFANLKDSGKPIQMNPAPEGNNNNPWTPNPAGP